MPSKIPVFVSAPTDMSAEQKATFDELMDILGNENLEPRSLGKSDYPNDFPLREVAIIARHCSGGIILGFSQVECVDAKFKPWNTGHKVVNNYKLPSQWNNLEAGMLFTMDIPLMVFREAGIEGGVFDVGVTDVFLQKLPLGGFAKDRDQVVATIQIWAGRVRDRYRDWRRFK